MISALSTIASGLDAQRKRLDVSAHNVANIATPGFEPSSVTLEAQASGGVTATVQPSSISAGAMLSATDLVTETVTQMSAVNAYKTQISVLRTQDEVTKTLTHTV